MSNNEIVIVEGQQDLFTGEVVETEVVVETEIGLEQIVSEITGVVFEGKATITAYKIAKVINGVFAATGTDKVIPPQMMYNYGSKGMIVKGYKGKEYTRDQVEMYVNKYTSKHVVL